MKRFFIVQHGLVDRRSHFYGETKGWREACRKRGIPLHLYVNRDALPELVDELSASPGFPHAPDATLEQDATFGRLSDFVTLAERFAQSCSTLQADGITADDVMVVPYATEREVFGAALWLERIAAASRPTIVFIFHRPDFAWTMGPDRTTLHGDISHHRYGMKRMQAVMPAEKLLVHATTAGLATVLAEVFQHPCEHGPHPSYYVSDEVLLATDGETGPRVKVRLAGELRREKGSDLAIAAILRTAELRPGTSFAMQVYDPQDAEEIAAALAPLSRTGSVCYVQTGQLSHELYQRRLIQSDILLLPYRPARYVMRASGVFSEGAGFGIVMVVPNRTWMADMLDMGLAAGTVFAEPVVADIAAALAGAIDAHAELSALAQRRAPEWRRANSVDALLDRIVRRLTPA